VVADLALENSGSAPLLIPDGTFTATTLDGTEYKGTGLSYVLADGCEAVRTLAAGDSVHCKVVFELPSFATTATISYRDPDTGATTEAPLETSPCHMCAKSCVDLANDAKNCGFCGRDVGAGQCVNATPVCNSGADTCGGTQCLELQSDVANCGACGNALPDGFMCENGQATCPGALVPCGDRCVDLQTDYDNCGACGAGCPMPKAYTNCDGQQIDSVCSQGRCLAQLKSYQRVTCDSICSKYGETCYYAAANYSPSSCLELDLKCNQVPPPNQNVNGKTWVFEVLHCACTGP
jgi:hypothetical protein